MKFYIDFTGYCKIEANDKEEARQKFWDYIYNINEEDLPGSIYFVENIEEEEI